MITEPPDSDPRGPAKSLVERGYERGRLIGHGATGEVFAARHVLSRKWMALKVIRLDGRQGRTRAGRFVREAKIAMRLRHPNIVEVTDAFRDRESGTAVIVMELLVGETLAKRRERAGTMPLAEAASLVLPVARALAYSHERGVVHRDLKPENIFLATEGSGTVPKVLDFGIAKVVDPGGLFTEDDGYATRADAVVGTPRYMATEQVMSEPDVDRRADIWSLGVILFEMLAGRGPIDFKTQAQMFKAHDDKEVIRSSDTLPHLPRDVTELLDRCLAFDKAKRPETLAPFIAVMERHAPGDASGARAAALPAPWTRLLGRAVRPVRLAITGFATVVGAGVWIAAQARARVPLEGPQSEARVDTYPATLALGPRPGISPGTPPTEGTAARTAVHPSAPRRAPSASSPPVSVSAISPAPAGKRGIVETPPY